MEPSGSGLVTAGLPAAVRVFVEDNGPGIPPEYREKVFEKFGQVKAPGQRRKYSTGLGLLSASWRSRRTGARSVGERSRPGEHVLFELPPHGPSPRDGCSHARKRFEVDSPAEGWLTLAESSECESWTPARLLSPGTRPPGAMPWRCPTPRRCSSRCE